MKRERLSSIPTPKFTLPDADRDPVSCSPFTLPVTFNDAEVAFRAGAECLKRLLVN
jgi:hypothetical protein